MNGTYLEIEARLGGEYLHAGGRRATELLLRSLNLPAGSQILEIGCGTGATTQRLASLQPRLIAAGDRSRRMLKRASRRCRQVRNLQFILLDASAPSLPFARGGFDLVLAESVAGILDFQAALPAWADALRPGGWLALNDGLWKEDAPPDEIDRIVRLCIRRFGFSPAPRGRQTLADWKRSMARCGFGEITAAVAARPGRVHDTDAATRRRRRLAKLIRPGLWPALLRYKRSQAELAPIADLLEYWIILARKGG